ncbi:MAG: hypothetical protein VX590_02690 [Chloroflexota bacterium]|nr:hypothetical protein [Chloroflexota bacterium]
MLKFKKIYTIILSILIILIISCGDEGTPSINDKAEEIKKFEYLGYEFADTHIIIHAKNYNPEIHTIQVNSSDYLELNQEEDLSEITFKNLGYDKASLKLEVEEQIISKLLVNPRTEYPQKSANQIFEIKVNETVFIEETSTILTLLDVAEDSRCPNPEDNNPVLSRDGKKAPGSCVHKPKTLIHFRISTPKYPQFDDWFYKQQLSDYEFFYGGNNFSVIEIKPDILKLNRLIPKEDYSLTILSSTN